MKKRATAYWLLPSGDEQGLLRKVIGILSREFDAPNFEPHLTILVADGTEPPEKVLKQVQAAPIRLTARGVSFSSELKKTLFIRFSPNAELKKLTGALSRATKSRATPIRDLHVSLLYKKLPRSVKKELAATLHLPFRGVLFDSIQAIDCASRVTTRADVKGWRVAARKSLARKRRAKRR
jgi:hypothetical protein